MWQKCPVCSGTGNSFNSLSNSTSVICDVCNGRKIISEMTGLPPVLLSGKEGLDLKMLDEKLDKALNGETEKSMSDFLNKRDARDANSKAEKMVCNFCGKERPIEKYVQCDCGQGRYWIDMR
jgi:DnaJ-class molecular chaperone